MTIEIAIENGAIGQRFANDPDPDLDPDFDLDQHAKEPQSYLAGNPWQRG